MFTKKIDLTDELESAGAYIYTYEELKIDPKSKFTIINYGKADFHVAIGKTYRNKHIEEYIKCMTLYLTRE